MAGYHGMVRCRANTGAQGVGGAAPWCCGRPRGWLCGRGSSWPAAPHWTKHSRTQALQGGTRACDTGAGNPAAPMWHLCAPRVLPAARPKERLGLSMCCRALLSCRALVTGSHLICTWTMPTSALCISDIPQGEDARGTSADAGVIHHAFPVRAEDTVESGGLRLTREHLGINNQQTADPEYSLGSHTRAFDGS